MTLEQSAVDWGIVVIFVTVYVGMFLGGLPQFKLDRSGVALLGGFYTAVTRRVAALPLGRNALLAALIAVAGVWSTIFSNDIFCLTMTPVMARLCLQRQRNPVAFLVGLVKFLAPRQSKSPLQRSGGRGDWLS